MLSKPVLDAINEQIKHEVNSAYLYLSMSAYCESLNLPGFARWLRIQWGEELEHAMKLFNMINDRGGRVVLQAIDRPPAEFRSVADVFHQVVQHEQKVTGLINGLYVVAMKENDYATQVELQWFIKEQTEEEKTAGDVLVQLKAIGESPSLLMMMDRQMGARGSKS